MLYTKISFRIPSGDKTLWRNLMISGLNNLISSSLSSSCIDHSFHTKAARPPHRSHNFPWLSKFSDRLCKQIEDSVLKLLYSLNIFTQQCWMQVLQTNWFKYNKYDLLQIIFWLCFIIYPSSISLFLLIFIESTMLFQVITEFGLIPVAFKIIMFQLLEALPRLLHNSIIRKTWAQWISAWISKNIHPYD